MNHKSFTTGSLIDSIKFANLSLSSPITIDSILVPNTLIYFQKHPFYVNLIHSLMLFDLETNHSTSVFFWIMNIFLSLIAK